MTREESIVKFIENRKIAWMALALCVALSIFLLGGMRLQSDRAAVVDVFYQGTDAALSARHSMDGYIDRACDAAAILAQEGTIHLGADDADSFLVGRIVQDLEASENMDANYGLVNQLHDSVEILYSAMLAQELTEDEMTNAKIAYYDFKGALDLMQNDQYHQLASDFNKASSGPLAKLLGGIFGVRELNTYG